MAKLPAPMPPESGGSIPWPEDGVTEAIQPQHSDVRIQVFSGGRVPKLGHNHVLTVPRLQGRVWTQERGRTDGARFELSFRLDELEIDRPELRAAMGPAFASVLDAEAVAGTRAHMLGPDNLEADRFPLVRMRSIRVTGQAPQMSAEIEIELHGQRRRQAVALEARRDANAWAVRGAFRLRQSDYGITPYAVLGGLLAVQDELSIDFTLSTRQ
ncbi:YceI family protein [Burkholderiaceae bacterium UC74_6]